MCFQAKVSMDIDKALEATNPLGRTQLLIVFVSILANFQIAFLLLSVSFNAETPPHHCIPQEGKSLNESIPITDDVYSSCEEFVNLTVNGETQACSKGWDYDTELTGKSITSEWNLVCSQDVLPNLSQTFLFIGVSIGSMCAGPIADKYGRKWLIFFSLVLFNMAGIALAFSPNYVTFVALRFLMGSLFKGMQITLFTMLFEILIPRHRPSLGMIPMTFYPAGLIAMSGIAYLVRDWREFSLILMAPTILMMLLSWMLPESVRWLVSRGRLKKAESTLQMIAKFNKVDLPDFPPGDKTTNSPANQSDHVANDDQSPKVDDGDVSQRDRATTNSPGNALIQLFKRPTRTVTIIITWFWFSYTLGYFGFALTTGTLAGDLYVNFLLSSLVDIPARISALFFVKKTGNLLALMFAFGISSLVTVCVIIFRFLKNESEDQGLEWSLTVLALVGKFFIASVYIPLLSSTTELYPTTSRNTGTGFVQLIGNFGSLFCPLLIYLEKFLFNVTFITMAILALVAAILCLFLPETLNTTQPETPADLKKLFETKLLLKSIRRNFHPKVGNVTSDESEMAGNTDERGLAPGNDNPGYEP